MARSETSPFTGAERDFIRHEFCQHFSSYPMLADGISLRTWRTGVKAGQPKIPKVVAELLKRSLVEIPVQPRSGPWFRAYFTSAGFAALRALLQDQRSMDPVRFAHLREELGLGHAPAEVVYPVGCRFRSR